MLTQDVRVAWAMYLVHMLSVPCWIFMAARSLRNRLKLKRDTPIAGVLQPGEAEVFIVALLALYPVADALRGIDLCFDSTDGVCRAVWGVVPFGARMLVWWLRDVALLIAGGVFIDCNYSWTHAALGRGDPRSVRRVLWYSMLVGVIGLGAMMFFFVATNRQSFQAYACLFVFQLNFFWFIGNVRLLWTIFPALASCARTETPADQSAVENVRITSKSMMVANLMVVTVFPLLVIERLVLKNGHSARAIPEVSLASWVGSHTMPLVSTVSGDVYLNLAIEAVELAIGWFVFGYHSRIAGRVDAPEKPHTEKPQFLSEVAQCAPKDAGVNGASDQRQKFD